MPKGVPNKRYTQEFKIQVIETKLSYCETARQFEVTSHNRIASWERIYLTESAEVQIERRRRGSKGRPVSLPPKSVGTAL